MTDVETFFKEPKPTKKEFDSELNRMRPVIAARSGGRCEIRIPGVCEGKARSIHHRKPRGQGGTNDPSNLLHLDGDGVAGCHGWIERNRKIAYRMGWLVHTEDDPADIGIMPGWKLSPNWPRQ